MKTRLMLSLMALTALFSCSEDEQETMPTNSQSPLIELQFTKTPIDLDGLAVSFAEDVSYDEFDDTKFDIFLPPSSSKTGLVIFIHGGGFTSGDKAFIYNENYQEQILEFLSNGVAVATINYRLIQAGDEDGVLKCLNDSRRALQFIRYIHNELNIDKEKIVLFGSSAGASTALWLATNDDFKELENSDAVLLESTRVKGIALNATQSSLDIETRWLGDVFGEFGSTLDDIIQEFGEDTFYNFYGVSSDEEYQSPEIKAYRKEVDMLSFLSSDDPEIWVNNTSGHNDEPMSTSSFNHHPFHAREIKEFADAAGVPNVAAYGNPIIFEDPSAEDFVNFLIRKIKE